MLLEERRRYINVGVVIASFREKKRCFDGFRNRFHRTVMNVTGHCPPSDPALQLPQYLCFSFLTTPFREC